MRKLTDHEWWCAYTSFCHECFLYWRRQGDSIAVAFDKAREKTLNLKHYPYSNEREDVVNLEVRRKWNELYSQHTVELLYAYEEEEALSDLRICEHCGFPIFDGYYIAGEFYCCEKCAIDGGYAGDSAQFKKDINDGDDQNNPLWSEIYWSQWDTQIND